MMNSEVLMIILVSHQQCRETRIEVGLCFIGCTEPAYVHMGYEEKPKNGQVDIPSVRRGLGEFLTQGVIA